MVKFLNISYFSYKISRSCDSSNLAKFCPLVYQQCTPPLDHQRRIEKRKVEEADVTGKLGMRKYTIFNVSIAAARSIINALSS